MYSKWIFGLLILVLAACTSASPQPTQLPEPSRWQVQITPTLEWMGPLMNACAPVNGLNAILIDQVPFKSIDTTKADISITWGAPSALPPQVFELGRDEIALIVHPANNLQIISNSDWQAVFQGRILKWKTISPDQENLDSIQLIRYDSENDIQITMSAIVGEFSAPQSTVQIATLPQAARSFVASNLSALGYIPRRWLDPSVRRIDLETNHPEQMAQPILALINQPPTPEQQQWLQCLSLAIETTP